jgi:DNA polymerase IV
MAKPENTPYIERHWPRVIAHLDLDQYYAAVEILDFPELKGKPLIVGGLPGGRGVVSTASYEARKFGVHSAMASSKAARLCPQAIWRVPRMSRYVEKSSEIRAVFEKYTDQIEPLSLDEAFLDLTGSVKLFGAPEVMARRIKDDIFRETQLVASLGLAWNKFLAKVASDLEKPNGCVIVPPDQDACEKFLAPLPVSRLWGVGPKMREALNKLGFFTIGELARADEKWLCKRIGENSAQHLLALSRGIDNREVERGERPKSIGRENTFAEDLRDPGVMERELLFFADDVARRLRQKGLRCGGMTLKVRRGDFSTITRSVTFEEPTDLAEPLYKAASEMLRQRVDMQGQGVRLLGISAARLAGADEVTQTLFPDEQSSRRRDVAETVDRLRARFGDGAITRGRLLEGREETTGTPSDSLPDGDK